MFRILLLFTQFYLLSSIATASNLPKLNLEKDSITVSGVSSGAFMAVQLQVAFSSMISGAASIAGGVYWCSEGSVDIAKARCMKKVSEINSQRYIDKALQESKNNTIDNVENLKNKKVFLFHSLSDSVIPYTSTNKLKEFFAYFLSPQNIKEIYSKNMAHGYPTIEYGNPCAEPGIPWILNCGIDLAGSILQFFYTDVKERGKFLPQNLFPFYQKIFSTPLSYLSDEGSIYIPSSCQRGEKCRLHIALHGCQMNPEHIQNKFQNIGYNHWAESNRIVILYPGVSNLKNPYGCWDWFGYTDKNFALRSGQQIASIKNMIQALVSD